MSYTVNITTASISTAEHTRRMETAISGSRRGRLVHVAGIFVVGDEGSWNAAVTDLWTKMETQVFFIFLCYPSGNGGLTKHTQASSMS